MNAEQECSKSQLDIENNMPSLASSSSQQPQSNLNTPREVEHAPLNSPSTSIITISDGDDDDDDVSYSEDEDVIIIDSNYEENENNRKLLDRYNCRLKYKLKRAINILLNYHIQDLTTNQISILRNKKYVLCSKRNNRRTAEAHRRPRARPMNEEHNSRRLESLRRRYLEAIRISHQIMSIWFSNDLKYHFSNPGSEYMRWANNIITKDEYIPIIRGPDGEVESNELDLIIQDIECSDTESSSASELSTTSQPVTNDYSELHQHWTHIPYQINTYNQHIRRIERLRRRQQLRNRFKVIHSEFYNNEVSSQSKNVNIKKDSPKNLPSTSKIDGIEVIKPLQPDVHSVIRDSDSPLGNNNLSSIAQSIAATAKALSSPHIKIFDGIIKMAEALYKTTAEPIEGLMEEARLEKQDISVETDDMDDPYIASRKNFVMNDLQKTLNSVSNLLSDPVPLNQVKMTTQALSNSVQTRVRRTKFMMNEIVSRQISTTQSPPRASTSACQISTVDSIKSIRKSHRLRFESSRLRDDYEQKYQQKPGTSAGLDNLNKSATRQPNQPSPPISVIAPAPNDPESCIDDEPPHRRNSRQIVNTNSLSSDTATNKLLAPPATRVQRRSRSRIRNHRGPRRLCSPSPPSSRTRIISQEHIRKRSRSPLAKPRSPPTATSTTTGISASTVATAGATFVPPDL